jgi:hypothetical protein
MTSDRARCSREYCERPAKYHISEGWGLCEGDHNVAYYWAARPVYRQEPCSCKLTEGESDE